METAGEVRDLDIALELLEKSGLSPDGAVAKRLATERRRASLELQLEIRRWKESDFSRKWRSRLEL
jgi:hypothetical protein